ncbi:hypothetical protein [Pseudidiomarina aestuarii]|uniref:hypothetical protein n=1 Tax=Pseudidiomarina aestuarii TaxID=624146 RepID=UPI003A96CB20
MAFKIQTVNEITWPVTADIPQDGGKTKKHKFFGRFRYITRTEFNRLSALGEEALLRHCAIGFDDTPEDIKADEDEVKNICEIPYYCSAIYQAYLKLLVGSESKN